MEAPNPTNRRWLLAARPKGAPQLEDFCLEEAPLVPLEAGQLRVRHAYLSLDPYMRGRMNDAKSYAAPLALGEVMLGGTVGQVVESQHGDYAVGDWVLGFGGWQDYSVSDGSGLHKLSPALPRRSYALGLLGMPGLTAYAGLLDIGAPQPGETLVVAAASGAVGSVVGQIAKIKGCRVVGVAGGADKCAYVTETLGFDACLDHRAADFEAQLAAACPAGVDIYFENVGGRVLKAVLPLLNPKARIPLCGLIAHYNDAAPPAGPDLSPKLMATLLTRRVRVQGFIVFDDFGHRLPDFLRDMGAWLAEGKIHYREHHVDGLERAPQGFLELLQGGNFGKVIVDIHKEES